MSSRTDWATKQKTSSKKRKEEKERFPMYDFRKAA
jgi:hypothetical protein